VKDYNATRGLMKFN